MLVFNTQLGQFCYKQIIIKCLLSAPGNEPHERADVSLVGLSQSLIVDPPVFGLNVDGRDSLLHQDQVHEKPASSSVAVNERMNEHKAVVSERRVLHWMELKRRL